MQENLEKLRLKLTDYYADEFNSRGAMDIFMNECSTGYINSFNIRALCSEFMLSRQNKYLQTVKNWTDLSLHLQGSYGDPAAYNMGYLYTARNGRPMSWFCADTLDQAYALLNTAEILEPDDPLYIRILESILKYDRYIQQWYKGEDGFGLGYMDGEEPAGAYHTAVTRAICYYASMFRIFSKNIYRDKGIALLHYLLNRLDMNSDYHGSPLHNRCYASDALLCGYFVLAKKDDSTLKNQILAKMTDEMVPWAVSHQTPDGFWAHDRFGYQPGAAPPVIDSSVMGAYSWGMVAGFQVFAGSLLKNHQDLQRLLDRAFQWLQNHCVPGDKNCWGYHGWGMLAILAKNHPETLFPYGEFL